MIVQIAKFVVPIIVVGTYIYVNTKQSSSSGAWVPVVLWHGMGDSCCNPLSLGKVERFIENNLGLDKFGNKIYIHSIKIGNDVIEDTMNGYFKNVNKQIEEACEQIKNDPKLSGGYNAIGFSQGSQFLRAVAQRCPSPKMHNYISLGGQHQGVYGLPNCQYPGHKWCDYVRRLLNEGAYLSWVQDYLVQAEYWHDPLNEEKYKRGSIFLADINNEVTVNKDYIANLQQLDNIVFVKFNNDSMVEPIESEWFGFYTPGQAINITTLFSSPLYVEDRLGLKAMNSSGKLHFLSVDGDHLQFTWDWFNQELLQPYLKIVTK